MTRIYPDFAYGDGPRAGCWWNETCAAPDRSSLTGEHRCDVAIIGGGFTGISAALHLAQAGVSATVLESHYVGWGASGRNGGFCCLGGGMLEDAALDKAFGRQGRADWRGAELAAVRLVEDLIARFGLEVDRHSKGETMFAHRARHFEAMKGAADYYAENFGVKVDLAGPQDLQEAGMNAGYQGALTVPIGFGLNPRKYITGLAAEAEKAGAMICHDSPVASVRAQRKGSLW